MPKQFCRSKNNKVINVWHSLVSSKSTNEILIFNTKLDFVFFLSKLYFHIKEMRISSSTTLHKHPQCYPLLESQTLTHMRNWRILKTKKKKREESLKCFVSQVKYSNSLRDSCWYAVSVIVNHKHKKTQVKGTKGKRYQGIRFGRTLGIFFFPSGPRGKPGKLYCSLSMVVRFRIYNLRYKPWSFFLGLDIHSVD